MKVTEVQKCFLYRSCQKQYRVMDVSRTYKRHEMEDRLYVFDMSNISVCNCSFLMSFINCDSIETLKEDRLVG